MPKGRRAAVALDAGDFHRVVFRREGEHFAPPRRVGRPFSGTVDVDDEIPVALPGEAAGITAFAVVPGRAARPGRGAAVAVVCKLFLVRTLGVEVLDGGVRG